MVDMEKWAEYYTDIKNLENIAYNCRWREIVVIKHLEDRDITIRPIKCFSKDHLVFWIERLNLRTTLFDIYISNASVKLPPLPSDLYKLKESREYLNEHWAELIVGFDIFADIDIDKSVEREVAREWALKLTYALRDKDYKNVQLWDTSRGFHLFDLGKFKPEFVKELIMDLCCEHSIPMSNPVRMIDGKKYVPYLGKWTIVKNDDDIPVFGKPNCDTGIYDLRRIRRVPYSLHSKTGLPMMRIPI
jgi:hypothetical protein